MVQAQFIPVDALISQPVTATAMAMSSMPSGYAEALALQMRTAMGFATVPMRAWERWMRVECATAPVRSTRADARRFRRATAIATATNSTQSACAGEPARLTRTAMVFVMSRKC